jgi:hypothetical protein
MRQVGPRDHHAAEQREFRQRRAQQGEVGAERARVVADRLEHAPARRCAGERGVVVGVAHDGLQAQLRARLQPVDRRRTLAQERLDELGPRPARQRRAEIGACRGPAIARRLRIRGNPDHAARHRRGAADAVGLFQQQHAQAARGRGAGGRQAARARTQHDHVVRRVARHRYLLYTSICD